MKLRYQILAVLMCSALAAGAAFGQLSGSYTIDSASVTAGTNYQNFTDAINAINANGVTDAVTFTIKKGTYNETSPLWIYPTTNKPSALTPITFKPDVGATVVLNVAGQVTGTRYAIKIGNRNTATQISYITFDGSNAVGGTSRDWTIKATNSTYGIETLDLYGSNLTVKNCIINVASTSASSYGITLRDTIPVPANAVFENNKVTANYTIAIGRTVYNDLPGALIKGNELHAWLRGIYCYNTSSITIRDNEIVGDANAVYITGGAYGIYTFSPTGNTNAVILTNNSIHDFGRNDGATGANTINGIYVKGPATYTISNNKIYNILNSTSAGGTVGVHGIMITSGAANSRFDIFNNMISGLLDNDAIAGSNWTAGIRANSSGTVNIFDNSIYINGTARNHNNTGIIFEANTASDVTTLKNNIIICNQAGNATYKSYAVYKTGSYAGALNSDYNLLYNDGGGSYSFLGYSGSDRTTLDDWKLTTLDQHSQSKAVGFVNVATDLHLGSSVGDLALVGDPAAASATDIDGQTRNATYPYMGADESVSNPLPVELTTFTAHAGAKGTVLSWQTATEVNNRGFAIERRAVVSGGSSAWQQVGFVQGAGTSNAAHSYSYSDQVAMPGTYAYRLKQMDNDGAFKYYNQIEVTVGAVREFKLYGNYPNPFNPSTAIRFTVAQDGQAEMKVFNAIGQEVATVFNGPVQAGVMQEASFNASTMPSGMYFARLKSGNAVSVIKMMLMK